jgi:hypothetical protein
MNSDEFSKMQQYNLQVNLTLVKIDPENLKKIEDDDMIEEVGKELVEKFKQVYGDYSVSDADCEDDEGFAIVPVIIQTSQNKRYLGLVDVSLKDSGEHYDTIFFTNKGLFHQEELSEQDKKLIIPYRYRPLVEIVGDIHSEQYC